MSLQHTIIIRLSVPNDSLELYKKGEEICIVGQRKAGTQFIKNKTSLGNLICVQKNKTGVRKINSSFK